MGDTHVAQFYLWPKDNDINNLHSEISWVESSCDMIGNIGNIQRAQMGNLWETLEEMMLSRISTNKFERGYKGEMGRIHTQSL